MLNDILTIDQQWLLNKSDFPPISWPSYQLWPSPNHEWFPWSICNGCGMPAGNAYPSGHLVPSPHFGTCLCSNCWDQVPRTCHVFTRLSPQIPFSTFSILLSISVRKFKSLCVTLSVRSNELATMLFTSYIARFGQVQLQKYSESVFSWNSTWNWKNWGGEWNKRPQSV